MKSYISFIFTILILLSTLSPVLAATQAEMQAQLDSIVNAENPEDITITINSEEIAGAAGATAGAAVGIASAVLIFILASVLINLLLVIWALYDIFTSSNEGNWKALWAIVSLLLGIIGVALYYFIGRKERKGKKAAKKAGKKKRK